MLSMFDPALLVPFHALTALADHVPAAAAIVLLTLLVRTLLHPLVRSAFRASREGTGTGCLPMLLQLPVLWAVYRLFTSAAVAGHANTLLARTFLDAPLGAHLLTVGAPAVPAFAVLVAAALLAGWAGMLLARRMATPARVAADAPPEVAQMAERMQRIAPYLSFGAVLGVVLAPLAAALYLVTSAVWGVAERAWLHRRFPQVATA